MSRAGTRRNHRNASGCPNEGRGPQGVLPESQPQIYNQLSWEVPEGVQLKGTLSAHVVGGGHLGGERLQLTWWVEENQEEKSTEVMPQQPTFSLNLFA